MDNKMNEKNNEMAEDEVVVFTLEDEDGQELEFELLETYEKNGTTYYALAPMDQDNKDAEYFEYVILKGVTENGEETLITVDDDDELDDIADYFDDLFADEIDYDAKPPKK